MLKDNKILVGKSGEKELFILPNMANRHGLITGASGSGKTVTLKVIAESLSEMGVPVFMSDIKGDLAGTCIPGTPSEKLSERLKNIGIDPETEFKYKGFPVVFWDVFGKNGHPIRVRIQDVDVSVLAKMLGLSEVQEGVLTIVLRIAKDKDMQVIDLKDLRSLLNYVGENRKEYTISYGNVSTQSLGSIQRSVLQLEDQGGDQFFGEPAFDINDFIKLDSETGRGNVNILHAVELYKEPNLYACFMLWLLTTLNNVLPEVGDLDKPKMVFFFDEAHLLFDTLPGYMLTKITQVVKLIRSKGVGLFFISQSPNDIPNEILAQLSNKVQHTLRAYTPADQKVVKAVAESFRVNPEFDTADAILALGTGEAVISFANEKGEPNIAERATILPPQSDMNAIDSGVRLMVMAKSPLKGKYEEVVDNESAYEKITAENEEAEKLKAEAKEKEEKEKAEKLAQKEKEKAEKEAAKKKSTKKSAVSKAIDRAASTATSTITRKVVNSVLKNIFK